MKILMLNYEFPPLGGGAANATKHILKEFSRRNDLKIDLVTSSSNGFEIENFSSNIIIHKLDVGKKDIHFWKFKEILSWTFKTYFYVRKLHSDNDYDVCHCWFGWPSGIIGYLFRKKTQYIIALRGSDVPGYNQRLAKLDKFIFSPLSRIIWRNARRVVANSSGLKKLALKTKPDQKIDIIYNGVDADRFKPRYNKNKKLKIICVSRLVQRKGIEYLIKAVENLDVELIIIGKGNQEDYLKKIASKNVKFLGYVAHSELNKYYSEADIFALPSLNEGMSNTIMEAMASGLPIITTNTGGTKELIKDNGFVVKMKDSEVIEKAIMEYIKNPKLIKKHGKNSRKIAEKMSWGNIAEKYYKLYKVIK